MHNNTVFVTGGSGYLGVPVCNALVQQGYTVYNVDTDKQQTPGVNHLKLDFAHPQALASLQLLKPGAVIHLAESAQHRQDLSEHYLTNTAKTIQLLNACVQSQVEVFVHHRSHVNSGYDCYGYEKSKAAITDCLVQYQTNYGIKCVDVSTPTVAGADVKQHHGRNTVVEKFHPVDHVVQALLQQTPIMVHQVPFDLHQHAHDYVHVLDAADAIVKAMHHQDQMGVQCSPDDEFVLAHVDEFSVTEQQVTAFSDVVSFAEHELGTRAKLHAQPAVVTVTATNKFDNPSPPDWQAQYSVSDIIRHTIEWHQRKHKKRK